jgi:hypothetical protein
MLHRNNPALMYWSRGHSAAIAHAGSADRPECGARAAAAGGHQRLAERMGMPDGGSSLKARMPVLLETNIVRFASAVPVAKHNANSPFVEALYDLQQIGIDMGSLYCLFSSTSSVSWEAFDSAVERLERTFRTPISAGDRSDFIHKLTRGPVKEALPQRR